jgi:hypothetical protein
MYFIFMNNKIKRKNTNYILNEDLLEVKNIRLCLLLKAEVISKLSSPVLERPIYMVSFISLMGLHYLLMVLFFSELILYGLFH